MESQTWEWWLATSPEQAFTVAHSDLLLPEEREDHGGRSKLWHFQTKSEAGTLGTIRNLWWRRQIPALVIPRRIKTAVMVCFLDWC